MMKRIFERLSFSKKVTIYLMIILTGVIGIFILLFYNIISTKKNTKVPIPKTLVVNDVSLDSLDLTGEIPNSIYIYNAPNISSLHYCGEKVPLQMEDVFESFERDFLINVNDRTQMAMYIKRSGRYFPYFEKRLKEEGLPSDLKYLMVAESGMLQAISPAGARGFWQIMPATGRQFGLEITKEVDERYHLTRSTDVAVRYLKKSYEEFHNWSLASASYNMGLPGVASHIDRQEKQDYFSLWFNRETMRYIYRIIAIKEIMENYSKYGYERVTKYKPQEFTTIEVTAPIPDLFKWSAEHGISYKELKYYNPWILRSSLGVPRNSIKKYLIMIPQKTLTNSTNGNQAK